MHSGAAQYCLKKAARIWITLLLGGSLVVVGGDENSVAQERQTQHNPGWNRNKSPIYATSNQDRRGWKCEFPYSRNGYQNRGYSALSKSSLGLDSS